MSGGTGNSTPRSISVAHAAPRPRSHASRSQVTSSGLPLRSCAIPSHASASFISQPRCANRAPSASLPCAFASSVHASARRRSHASWR